MARSAARMIGAMSANIGRKSKGRPDSWPYAAARATTAPCGSTSPTAAMVNRRPGASRRGASPGRSPPDRVASSGLPAAAVASPGRSGDVAGPSSPSTTRRSSTSSTPPVARSSSEAGALEAIAAPSGRPQAARASITASSRADQVAPPSARTRPIPRLPPRPSGKPYGGSAREPRKLDRRPRGLSPTGRERGGERRTTPCRMRARPPRPLPPRPRWRTRCAATTPRTPRGASRRGRRRPGRSRRPR
jgi:hypothetical protein